jgi:hypothetical protein
MKNIALMATSAIAAFVVITGSGCVSSPEHRMNVAASRDDTRRSEFEHCRDQGRSDCDAILNAPVDSTTSGSSVREQERRAAYNRCVDRGGNDCDDILRR